MIQEIAWSPPMQHKVKFNVDGSVIPSRSASCGGILRNAGGDWITGFYRKLDSCSIACAELWRILTALHVAWNTGCKEVVIESDSKEAIKIFCDEWENRREVGTNITRQIMELVAREWKVSFTHTQRRQCGSILARQRST